MGPSDHFYSCISLVTRDTGIPQVDGLLTRHLGIWGITASSLGSSNGEVEELPLRCFRW